MGRRGIRIAEATPWSGLLEARPSHPAWCALAVLRIENRLPSSSDPPLGSIPVSEMRMPWRWAWCLGRRDPRDVCFFERDGLPEDLGDGGRLWRPWPGQPDVSPVPQPLRDRLFAAGPTRRGRRRDRGRLWAGSDGVWPLRAPEPPPVFAPAPAAGRPRASRPPTSSRALSLGASERTRPARVPPRPCSSSTAPPRRKPKVGLGRAASTRPGSAQREAGRR